MNVLNEWIGLLGPLAPWFCLLLFCAASGLVIWRLEVLSSQGVEGTVLGTLFMPFCSGMGNIVFALVMARHAGGGEDVLVNCLFNNITNVTLLIGLPVLIWGMAAIPRKAKKKVVQEAQMGRLALALNLVAALVFSAIVWLLGADYVLSRQDGVVLLVLFVFWQCFHVYDVKKTNLLKKQRYPATLPFDVGLLLVGAFMVFISTDWLVAWFGSLEQTALPQGVLGWASGVLMVLPNALLAFYYGAKARMDVVYTSQSGDAHICIPLCLGLFAVFQPVVAGAFFNQALYVLMGLCALHLLFVIALGRLPRWMGLVLLAGFGAFVWLGVGM